MFKKLLLAAVVAVMSVASYAQTIKIGYYDSQAIMNDMPETAVLESEYAKRASAADAELKKMDAELQTKAQDFNAQIDSLDDVTKQLRYEELQTLQQRMQQYQQAQGQQIQQYAQQQQMLIQEKLIKAVKAVGERDKFTVLLPKNDSFFFSETETTDITATVKKELGIK